MSMCLAILMSGLFEERNEAEFVDKTPRESLMCDHPPAFAHL
jgi:hypothetical protein